MKPREVLARHGSSFHMASRLLRRDDANDVATLYAVCRLIDDIADESANGAGRIDTFIEALTTGELAKIPVDGFEAMVERRQMRLEPLATLARTAAHEARYGRLIDTESELIDYCYGVAGTVGELMCPLLGADPVRGRDAAVALGIGMQLTNIARDVLEDAQRGRRYLPAEWVGQRPPEVIAAAADPDRASVQAAIGRVVDRAEVEYARAETAFALIPWRNRVAIRVAARLYRAIGLRVRDGGCRYWEGRTSLSHRDRRRLALRTLFRPADDAPAATA
ncbi:phytoene/squalene synthase family protein [Spiribacter vilamensis]|uniref:Phytoene synthase n=1 Tax=Spiribacter vilamensis TaxID=531306 RepID=A0A4V2GIZ2_9GAMM|nr:squalene/phytoene synthase family protein [Spiribacter vilamensis]RZU98295.1 phytoene synthase [Spiribacter vilamensis]TVO60813.1 phytoene/squalene synthase family protein [Spiribacter vilamensis]